MAAEAPIVRQSSVDEKVDDVDKVESYAPGTVEQGKLTSWNGVAFTPQDAKRASLKSARAILVRTMLTPVQSISSSLCVRATSLQLVY
jgi:hypothetical protein